MGKIILVGSGGCGKDTLKERLKDKQHTVEVSFTTRPPRKGEVDGVAYHFVTEEKFLQMVANQEFLQHKSFNGWLYGTSKKEWEEKNVFILTPEGLASLTPQQRDEAFIIYIKIDENIRRGRLMQRNDADTIERRLQADREQFDGFDNYDLIITNPNF
jgi:guanylate kinase